ncbi:hypothetical protein L1085_009560 [Streptomyces sp. MSC1_001]|jgi:hypothetical protein|uniref:hypothetical protein n=1 Tax=Streptomyces sp. MSC1_001 TaxID=2909263 RepID=UPI00202F3326|nr:hypothetical protein [Streptomyces sp. MSC1_001]
MTDLLPLADALTAGLHWLYETEQPADAWMSHHGQQIPTTVNRFLAFVPTAVSSLPVIVIGVVKPAWKEGPRGDMVPTNPLTPIELPRLAAELEQRGYAVRSTWNGFPGATGSVGLARPAHPSQIAAVDRYRAGCQEHPERSVFCECEAWRAGFGRAVAPLSLLTSA